MQVQETTLDWLVGLAAATALHLGPAVLTLNGQIVQVLKALFAAPSKASHRHWQLAFSIAVHTCLWCLQQFLIKQFQRFSAATVSQTQRTALLHYVLKSVEHLAVFSVVDVAQSF